DQQSVRPSKWIAGGVVEIAEQRQPSLHELLFAALVLLVETGDVVVHQLGDRGVLADDDEAGWDGDAALPPEVERTLIVTVKRFECRLQFVRELQRIEIAAGAASFLGHVLSDVLPEVAVHRHFVAWDVFGYWDARQLDDAALDC